MIEKRRFPWIALGVAAYLIWSPYLWVHGATWARWVMLLCGGYIGFGLGCWWRSGVSEESVLRRRLVRGEIRLSEYRLLCKELGLKKICEKKRETEQEILVGDGR